MWQDYVFALSNLFFILSLVPMLRNRETVVTRWTSVPTTICLIALAFTYLSLDLYWAAAATVALASLWTAVAFLRGPKS